VARKREKAEPQSAQRKEKRPEHKVHSAAKLQSKNKISIADYTDVADLHD
jgi:hypothetical protein